MQGGPWCPGGVLAVPKIGQWETYLWVSICGATCWGLAPAGSRGTLRMNGIGKWERERERKRETRLGCAAESGSCFIFHHRLYTLSWYISKGQISTQTQFNITSACPSQNQVFSVYFCLWESFPIDFFIHYLLALSLTENRKAAVSWYRRLQPSRNTILLTQKSVFLQKFSAKFI